MHNSSAFASVTAITVLLASSLFTQAQAQMRIPSRDELNAITARGRELAAYDLVARGATTALLTKRPSKDDVNTCVVLRNRDGWHVSFGKLNEKRTAFIAAYDVACRNDLTAYTVRKNIPPAPDTSGLLLRALAAETARAKFTPVAQRPYTSMVLPSVEGKMWVYLYPSQTRNDVFPLGGDTRFLVSADGKTVLEKRQMHVSILDLATPTGKQPTYGYHTAVIDDRPEDTDIMYVLGRVPRVPEMIKTNSLVFKVDTTGNIECLGTADKVLAKPAKQGGEVRRRKSLS